MSDTPQFNTREESMRDLVRQLAQALVDDPSCVEVELAADGLGITIRLRVAPGDLGKLIGKQGRTARSLRVILQAASIKHEERYSLDIESAKVATWSHGAAVSKAPMLGITPTI